MTNVSQKPNQPQPSSADLEKRIATLEAALREKETIEAALRRKQAMLARTEGIAHIGSWEWEVATDTVTWSAELFRIFQLDPADGAPPYAEHAQLYQPQDMARLNQAVETALKAGTPYELELRVIRADGEVRVCLARGFTEPGPGGSVDRLFGSLQDITEHKLAEENLKKYKNIVSSTPDGMAILDENYRYIIVNDAYKRFSGVNREQFIGKTVAEYLGDEVFRQHIKPNFDRCLQGETITYQEWFDYPTLGRRYIDVTYFPYRDMDNIIAGVVSITKDITERKQTEEALRHNEANLQSLFDAIDESVSLFDRNGKILAANKTFARRLGRSIDACIGQSVYALLPPEVAERRKKIIAEVIHDRQLVIFEDERLGRWHHHSICPVLDAEGEVDRLAIYALDITDRKQTEEALRASENRFREYFDLLPAYCYMISPEGTILDLNRAALRFLGYASKTEIMGQPLLTTIYTPASQAKAREMFLRWRETGQLDKDELTIVSKNGEERIVWLEASAIYDDNGQPLHSISIQVDITERKQAEAEREKLQAQLLQAQKMESVGRLAGGVAHDFNNMLMVILGRTEMALSRVEPTQPLYADLEEIHKAAQHSADLTRQLLTFARKQIITPRVLDLNETVAGMLKMLQRLIGEDIDLVWKPAARLWPALMDPTQIDQILANLAVNARDAIAGVGTLTIETENAVLDAAYCALNAGAVPGDYVVLAVSDTGIGMDREIIEHLFEPFFTTKGMAQGTGLGLATIYGIVKQNNGYISVYSEPGYGTVFKIYLPRHLTEEAQLQSGSPATEITGGSETILLVEDEPAILELTRLMLKEFGYRVLIAGAPDEALRLAEAYAGEIHLLMTDVVMPGMNGRDLADRLWALYPTLKCLFMSGYTADIIAHRGVVNKGVSFIQKPFTLKHLAASVRAALDQVE